MRDRIQGISQGATGVGQDALNTVGGGVKGVVDTAGNTVRTYLLSFMGFHKPFAGREERDARAYKATMG